MAKVTHYSIHSSKRHSIRTFTAFVVLIFVALFLVTLFIRHEYLDNLEPVSASGANQLITIPTGSSLSQIADTLKKNGVIRSNWAFEWYVRNDNFARDDLEAGTYNFRPNEKVADIVNQLTEGRIATNLLVILPGQRIDQITQAFVNNGYSKSQAVAALNPTQYNNQYSMFQSKPPNANLEGFLYPDSFQKNTDTSATQIVNESLSEMQKKLTPDILSGFASEGLSVFQGVTLASIVEQEVSNDADKPIVAQVFLLRLKENMPLGSDVTAFYGAIVNGQSPSVSYDSPYNTRIHTGLPPGPISNVSTSSLEAVAHPANTNYLYFVTGDNGTTYYSQTLDQHNQQVQQYCQKLCN